MKTLVSPPTPIWRRVLRSLLTRLTLHTLANDTGIVASVIIATGNHASYLRASLAALERQRLPKRFWEVVIIDNASRDDTQVVIEEYTARHRINLRSLSMTTPLFMPELLNQGILRSHGPILIFLGETQIAHPDFVFHHVLMHAHEQCSVIGDHSQVVYTHLFDPGETALFGSTGHLVTGVDDIFSESSCKLIGTPGPDFIEVFDYVSRTHGAKTFPWALFDAKNASLPRAAIGTVGGFDEQFHLRSFAAQELAYRLLSAGYSLRYSQEALTVRQAEPSELDTVASTQYRHADIHHFLAKHSLTKGERKLVSMVKCGAS